MLPCSAWAGTSRGRWSLPAGPLRAATVTLPPAASQARLSPCFPHFSAPGCQVSSPCPAPDPATVPTPVFTVLALLPQHQKPFHGFCLSRSRYGRLMDAVPIFLPKPATSQTAGAVSCQDPASQRGHGLPLSFNCCCL